MLPSELLVARVYKGTIRPVYARLNEANLLFSERLVQVFNSHLGQRKGKLEEEVAELEEAGQDFRFVRGLVTLLERRSRFEVNAELEPYQVRDRLFHAAAEKGIPTTLQERREILEEEALHLNVLPEVLENSMYADLDEETFLTAFQPIEAKALLNLYNLSLVQTLVFKSTEMEFTAAGNWQKIFRMIKWLGLIYRVQSQGETYWVKVDGPTSLFKLNNRYGTSLAKLVPDIVSTQDWRIKALILRRRGDRQLFKLDLNSQRHSAYLKEVEPPPREEYDSMVEKRFADRFKSLRTGWDLKREPEPLPVGSHVMIPDFLLEKAGMKVYLEVAGFWTQEYLVHKLQQLKAVEEVDMIVAADRSHACQQLNTLSRKLDIVYYKGDVPLKPILNHLRSREQELKKQQKKKLQETELQVKKPIETTEEIAKRLGVLEEAVKESLNQIDIQGYQNLGDIIIKDSILQKIAEKIDERTAEGSLTLKEAQELVEEMGGSRASIILLHLGYNIKWHGINPEKAKVQKAV